MRGTAIANTPACHFCVCASLCTPRASRGPSSLSLPAIAKYVDQAVRARGATSSPQRDTLRASPCAPCLRGENRDLRPLRQLRTTGARRAESGACRGRSGSCRSGRRVEGRARVRQVDDVEDVGRLEAELQASSGHRAGCRGTRRDRRCDSQDRRRCCGRPCRPAPIAGCAKAAVLNHCSISSSRGRPLSSFGIADDVGAIVGERRRSCGRCPDEIVSGVPLCSVTIAETVQSFEQRLDRPLRVVEVIGPPDGRDDEAVRAVGGRAGALQVDPVRVLHRRQAAALVVDVLERLAERVVGLGREARRRAARRSTAGRGSRS